MQFREESRHILSIIQKKGPLTKKQLQSISKYKLTSLNRHLQALFEEKYIGIKQYKESSGGRPSGLLSIDTKKYGLIGIDISRTYVNLVLTNLRLETLAQTKLTVDMHTRPKSIIDDLCKEIKEYTKLYPKRILLGIGLGIVGPVDPITGNLSHPERFPSRAWEHMNFKKQLEGKLNLPVCINSGATAALTYEHFFGKASNYQNIAYINCGVSIRDSVLLSGHPISTNQSYENSLAHTIVEKKGNHCSCGQKGCVDSYSSIHALFKGHKTEGIYNYSQYKKLLSSSDNRNRPLISQGAKMLGLGLANYIRLFNLEYVILSGPLIEHDELYYQLLTATASSYLKTSPFNHVCFSRGGTSSHHSIALGGACLFFENLIHAKRG